MWASWRVPATRAWASPWWGARTPPRDPSASTSRASSPVVRHSASSKKVRGCFVICYTIQILYVCTKQNSVTNGKLVTFLILFQEMKYSQWMVGQWLASPTRRPSASSRRSSWGLFKSPLDGGSPETLSSPYVNRWLDCDDLQPSSHSLSWSI